MQFLLASALRVANVDAARAGRTITGATLGTTLGLPTNKDFTAPVSWGLPSRGGERTIGRYWRLSCVALRPKPENRAQHFTQCRVLFPEVW